MNIKSLVSLPLLALLVSVAVAAGAEVKVKVKGMVCSFCAQGLDKKFREQAAVEDVKVTLEDKIIRLTIKEGQALDDKRIRAIVEDSGYNVQSIER